METLLAGSRHGGGGALHPIDEEAAERGLVGEMNLFAGAGDEAEPGAVGGAVEDACVREAFVDLATGLGADIVGCSIELKFPANEDRSGKHAAQSGDDFRGGLQGDGEGA